MSLWSKYPFVRMLLPFALGIWTKVFFASFQVADSLLVEVMLAMFAMAAVSVFVVKGQRVVWVFGAVMACYLFIAGFALARFHEASAQKDYYRNREAGAKHYVARICDDPSERDNSVKAQLQLQFQFGDSIPSQAVSGRVVAYFRKSDEALALRYGDLVAIPAPVGEVQPPKNPEEFDYQAYLARRGITGQVYLSEQDWIDLEANDANPLFSFSYRFRDQLIASLRHCGLEGHELGVAAAILLGYDDFLEDEMRQKYVAAGSMHILCVSGMHVGIVYLVASLMLGFLHRKKWHKTLKNILLMCLVWYYALVAGLSPSILRASMMISFVIIGELIRRKGFVINSIAASAFILLLVNPYNLFDIGFQLSYSAVIGIVMLQSPIYRLFFLKNKLVDKIWEITSVALAAQVATLPFTLFYFQQFSTYFWLSNLFMTPISFVVVMGGMLLLMVSWIPYVSTVVGYMVWGMIYVMNHIVTWIDGLPFSILKGLYVSEFEFVMLLFAVVLLLLLVALRKKRYVFELLAVMLLFMVSLTVRLYRSDRQDEMVFFSLRKHTAVDFVKGDWHLLLADSALLSDPSTMDYSMNGFWAKNNLARHPETLPLDADYDGTLLRKKENLVSFGGKLLALCDERFAVADSLSFRLPVDYLLVCGNQRPNLRPMLNGYAPQLLVIDGSVPRRLAAKWMAQADEMDLPVYDLDDGALTVRMKD